MPRLPKHKASARDAVLVAIVAHGIVRKRPVRVHELARFFGVKDYRAAYKGRVGGMIDRLVGEGLVERTSQGFAATIAGAGKVR